MIKSKRKIIAIALTLIFVLPALLIVVPHATAATRYPVFSFITANPNPAGVGQDVLVLAFIDRYPPSNASNRYIPYVDFVFDVTITDPSGTITTRKILSDPIGGSYFIFNPNAVGTWTLKMHFEGAGPIAGNANNTYLPSDSAVYSLTVQQNPSPEWPAAPLPTGYWERPINNENREWSAIAGNWLGMIALRDNGASTFDSVACFNPYTTAPKTAHIIWTLPIIPGGIAGVPNSDEGFYTGDSYERQDHPCVIMNGVFYRNRPQTNNIAGNGFEAVDLRTGKILWTVPNGTITWGQLLKYDSQNQHGVIPYLWNSQLQVFDAATGGFLLQFNNTVSGSKCQDANGNILSYTLSYSATNSSQRFLILWNSTLAMQYGAPVAGAGFGAGNPDYWRPPYNLASSLSYNWLKGVQWNVTVPDLSAYGVTGGAPSVWMLDIYDKVVICRFAGAANDTYPIGYTTFVGYSMTDGHQMWAKLYTDQSITETGALGGASIGAGPGYFFLFKQETLQWHAYNALTGELAWKSDPFPNSWATYYTTLSAPPATAAYGKLYTIGYDGYLHCFDIATGKLLWNALGFNSGTETPYGSWPTSYIGIADGKVYIGNGEHSPNQPLYRGYELYCVDANTGQLLFDVSNYAQSIMIADGELLAFNGYDGQEYAFDKGLSATTIQTPLTGIAAGDTIAITGTITDQSPGQTCLGIPAAGTPAISDVSMSAWMEYLYMQKPQPTNATGVPMNLVAIDSSGAATNIGTVTSNSMGFFNTHWTTPTTPGDYQIVANFAGTDSYYASSAIAAVTVVGAAPTPASASDVASAVVSQLPTPAPATPAPTAPSASDVASQVVSQLPSMTNTDMILVAAIVVAILIGLVNLVLLMRKKQA